MYCIPQPRTEPHRATGCGTHALETPIRQSLMVRGTDDEPPTTSSAATHPATLPLNPQSHALNPQSHLGWPYTNAGQTPISSPHRYPTSTQASHYSHAMTPVSYPGHPPRPPYTWMSSTSESGYWSGFSSSTNSGNMSSFGSTVSPLPPQSAPNPLPQNFSHGSVPYDPTSGASARPQGQSGRFLYDPSGQQGQGGQRYYGPHGGHQ